MKFYKISFLEKNFSYILAALSLFSFLTLAGSSYLIVFAPDEYLQGIYAKIMYVHIPSAWMAIGLYVFISLASLAYVTIKNPLYDIIAKATAPVGLTYTVITLVTGSIWGKPTWGAWWVWDARLTSMLILCFIYVGYIVLRNAHNEESKAAMACSIFALVGLINIPIIKFSVYLWNTLHQGSSFFGTNGLTIHNDFLVPLVVSTLFVIFFTIILIVLRVLTAASCRKVARLNI